MNLIEEVAEQLREDYLEWYKKGLDTGIKAGIIQGKKEAVERLEEYIVLMGTGGGGAINVMERKKEMLGE